MPIKEIGKVLTNEEILKGQIFKMVIKIPEISREATPGQFLEIKRTDSGLLRKPISIYERNGDELTILYQVVGCGTKNFTTFKSGDEIDVIGPLGRGFPLLKGGKALLLGGGIGIAPLNFLGREMEKNGVEITSVLGFNSKCDSYEIDTFVKFGRVGITTMDGTLGKKGHIGSILEDLELKEFDRIYACGPELMLDYVRDYSLERGSDTYLSLEGYMGCGLGACLSCVVKNNIGENMRICSDGPVFKGSEVIFNG